MNRSCGPFSSSPRAGPSRRAPDVIAGHADGAVVRGVIDAASDDKVSFVRDRLPLLVEDREGRVECHGISDWPQEFQSLPGSPIGRPSEAGIIGRAVENGVPPDTNEAEPAPVRIRRECPRTEESAGKHRERTENTEHTGQEMRRDPRTTVVHRDEGPHRMSLRPGENPARPPTVLGSSTSRHRPLQQTFRVRAVPHDTLSGAIAYRVSSAPVGSRCLGPSLVPGPGYPRAAAVEPTATNSLGDWPLSAAERDARDLRVGLRLAADLLTAYLCRRRRIRRRIRSRECLSSG